MPIGRAAQLRQALDVKFSGFLATIGPLSETQWAWPCPREGWPVGYVAHHVGQGIVRPSGWITQALAGADPFNFEWDVTHELNARRSQRLGLPASNGLADDLYDLVVKLEKEEVNLRHDDVLVVAWIADQRTAAWQSLSLRERVPW